MIITATSGLYDELSLSRGLPDSYRQTYFEPADNKQMLVKAKAKSLTRFTRLKLLSDYTSLGSFDIVFCRNVLIYFDGKQKIDILKKIAACLPSGGCLFLGAAESISGVEHIFKMQKRVKGSIILSCS